MKITIVTGGSRGDVQPYVALGKGLKSVGYQVKLIASQDFETLVTGAGLTFCSTGIGVESILQSDEWRRTTEGGNFLAIVMKMQKEMKKYGERVANLMPQLLEDSNLIVSGVAGIGGAFSIAEKFNIPIVQAHVFPMTPTKEFPSPLTPTIPKFLNPLSFGILRQMLWQSVRSSDVATRQILGMSKSPFLSPFKKLDQKRIPTLYGYSSHVLPPPKDWDNQTHVTGYWFLDEADGWQPSSEFVDFLEAGSSPVYIGFGSMINRNPEKTAQIVLEALALSGQRGVLASGWGGMSQTDLPDNVYMISSIPHSWLFPKMAAVVHHGGAGTTAAGLRAGVPTIIVPFMGDQPFWGKQVQKLGVGTEPIPRKKLTAKHLAESIREVMTNTDIQNRAKTLGQNIRHEGGVENAVAVIRNMYPV